MRRQSGLSIETRPKLSKPEIEVYLEEDNENDH
jgi:hypothetical protein